MFSCVFVGSMSATARSHDSQALSSFHFSSLCCDVDIWRCWCGVYGLAAQQAAARDLIVSDHDSKARNNCILVKAWTNAKKSVSFCVFRNLPGLVLHVSSSHLGWEPLDLPGEVIITFAMVRHGCGTKKFWCKKRGRSHVSTIFGFMRNPFLASVLHHACGMQKPLGAGAVETTGDDFEPNHYKSLGFLDAVFVFCRCLAIISTNALRSWWWRCPNLGDVDISSPCARWRLSSNFNCTSSCRLYHDRFWSGNKGIVSWCFLFFFFFLLSLFSFWLSLFLFWLILLLLLLLQLFHIDANSSTLFNHGCSNVRPTPSLILCLGWGFAQPGIAEAGMTRAGSWHGKCNEKTICRKKK